MQKMRQILQKNGLLFGPAAQKAQKAESPFLLIKGQALASIEKTESVKARGAAKKSFNVNSRLIDGLGEILIDT